MSRIVVGVDGSEHSRRALRRAVEEGAMRGWSVDALYVYEPPQRSLARDLIGLPYGLVPASGTISPDSPAHHPPKPEDAARERAADQLEAFLDEVLAGSEGPRPRAVVVAGDHPAEALIEQSATADLLVVGTRGLGGFTGMLVGSVAHQCIQHARCPMLILPPADR